MKNLFFFTLFVFCSAPANADWIAVEKKYQTGDRETVYFDPTTIHRDETRARLWQLTDIEWNSTTRFLSSKTHKEFDCERSRVRILQVVEFSRQMGKGRQTAGFIENGNWQSIEEGTVNHSLRVTACKKR